MNGYPNLYGFPYEVKISNPDPVWSLSIGNKDIYSFHLEKAQLDCGLI